MSPDSQGVKRTPFHVCRKPITCLTDSGAPRVSGMFIFANPNGRPSLAEAVTRRITKCRLLWCPYCGSWEKYYQDSEERDVWRCISCNTTSRDFYVKQENNTWWDNVPFAEVKKLSNIRF